MTINGVDALKYKTPRKGKQPKPVHMLMTPENLQRSAAAAAGIDWKDYQMLPGNPEWVDPENPTDCKTDIIMWYRYKEAVDALSRGGM